MANVKDLCPRRVFDAPLISHFRLRGERYVHHVKENHFSLFSLIILSPHALNKSACACSYDLSLDGDFVFPTIAAIINIIRVFSINIRIATINIAISISLSSSVSLPYSSCTHRLYTSSNLLFASCMSALCIHS